MGGKKPSKRKASTKQTTSAVRKIIDSADDVERSKRVKTVAGLNRQGMASIIKVWL